MNIKLKLKDKFRCFILYVQCTYVLPCFGKKSKIIRRTTKQSVFGTKHCYKIKYASKQNTKWQRVSLATLHVRLKVVNWMSILTSPKQSAWYSMSLAVFLQYINLISLVKFILHAWKDSLIFAKLTHYLFIAPYDRVDKGIACA